MQRRCGVIKQFFSLPFCIESECFVAFDRTVYDRQHCRRHCNKSNANDKYFHFQLMTISERMRKSNRFQVAVVVVMSISSPVIDSAIWKCSLAGRPHIHIQVIQWECSHFYANTPTHLSIDFTTQWTATNEGSAHDITIKCYLTILLLLVARNQSRLQYNIIV